MKYLSLVMSKLVMGVATNPKEAGCRYLSLRTDASYKAVCVGDVAKETKSPDTLYKQRMKVTDVTHIYPHF